MPLPHGPLSFLYWVFFKPISLRCHLDATDPSVTSIASILSSPGTPSTRLIRIYALLFAFLIPILLGFGLAMIFSSRGLEVNWLRLALYLFIGIVMSSTFSLSFGIAFLIPFSFVVAVGASMALNFATGVLFSFAVGLAYGLRPNHAAWGMIASLV